MNWQLQRAVRTNDVDGYIHVLSSIIEIFFASNRPNYARWGSLFLHKLQQMNPKAREILEAGAMSIRRTKKSYARSAIDLGTYQVLDGPVFRGMQKRSPDLGKIQVCYYSFLPAFKGFCECCRVALSVLRRVPSLWARERGTSVIG